MFKRKNRSREHEVKSTGEDEETIEAVAISRSTLMLEGMREALSNSFTQHVVKKLYPKNNVHVYAYEFKKDDDAKSLTDCTILIDYKTGKPCTKKCKSTVDTQNPEHTLCKINRFNLLDTNLCFCTANKSVRDDSYVLAFFNTTAVGRSALLVMFDFYKMMSGEVINLANLAHLYNYIHYRTLADERECKNVAKLLSAETFKTALNRFPAIMN